MGKYFWKVNSTQNSLEKISCTEGINISGDFFEDIKGIINKFKDIYVVNCLQDYILVINHLLIKIGKKGIKMPKLIYRGLSKKEEFDSKIIRNQTEETKNKEFMYIRKFEENGCIKLGQFNNPIDLAAAADHYGVYTRLIDWSYNPFVATLFSIYSLDKDCNQCSAVLVYDTSNGVILNSLKEDFNLANAPLYKRYESMIKNFELLIKEKNRGNSAAVYQYFEDVYDKTFVGLKKNYYKKNANKFMKNTKLLIETNYSNERIVAQKGLFEIQRIGEENDFSGTSMILISYKAREDIIKYINRLGTNYYSLMNDPASASEYINATISEKLKYK